MGRGSAVLWQVNSPQSARTFLDKFGNHQSQHHRVTLRFATGDLRSDMETWAADHGLSDALRLELLSYQWCKLDDTWAEASHRDVSREASRCTNASQAWISATLRMHQNLDMWDTLEFSSRRRFELMFPTLEAHRTGQATLLACHASVQDAA